MSKIGTLIGIWLLCFHFYFSSAQQSKPDSIKNLLQEDTLSDIEKINLNYDLAFEYENSLPDTALEYYKTGLKLSEETNSDILIAKGYNGIGNIHFISGRYTLALDYFFKALKIFESKHIDNSTIYCLQYIGMAYNAQGIFDKAMKYSTQALEIAQSIGDKYKTGVSMLTIGSIYYSQHNYGRALDYFQQALHSMEEAGDKQGISDALNNVALIYEEQKNFDKALGYHLISLKMAKELNDKRGIAASYHNIAEVYKSLENFPIAIQYFDSCIASAKETDSKSYLKESYNSLSELYDRMGNYEMAYKTHLTLSQLKDSLLNEESKMQFAEMSTKYETEKKDNEIEIKTQKLKRQEIMRNGLIGGIAVGLVFFIIVFTQKKRLTKEKTRSDELLLNILPAEVAEELKQTGHSKARTYSMATVMFIDFMDFTEVSEKISAELLVAEIDHCFSAYDNIIQTYGVEKIKTVGDAYMCVSGLPVLTFTHALDMVKAALDIRNFMLERKKEKDAKGEISFRARIGIHTGPVVAGIVGVKKFSYDIWGDTVNIASRMESSGEVGKVNISGTTYELVKEKFKCVHRGKITAKHKGEIDMYFVEAN